MKKELWRNQANLPTATNHASYLLGMAFTSQTLWSVRIQRGIEDNEQCTAISNEEALESQRASAAKPKADRVANVLSLIRVVGGTRRRKRKRAKIATKGAAEVGE